MPDSLLATYPSLAGRTVLVTGGASGIGEAIVRAFAGQRAKVGFVDIQEKEGSALAAELSGQGAKIHFEPADITDIAALQAAIAKIASSLGPIAVLVNNAANDTRHDWQGETPESFDARLAVNLKHQFFAIQAVAPGMIDGGRRLDRQFRLDLMADRHGRHAGLHGVEGGDRGADALLRARPRAAPHPREHRAPGLDHDQAAARALGRRERRRGSSPSGSACPTASSPTRSRAWCSSSPPTTAPCAPRRISSSTRGGCKPHVIVLAALSARGLLRAISSPRGEARDAGRFERAPRLKAKSGAIQSAPRGGYRHQVLQLFSTIFLRRPRRSDAHPNRGLAGGQRARRAEGLSAGRAESSARPEKSSGLPVPREKPSCRGPPALPVKLPVHHEPSSEERRGEV